jgi:hypothetical protein
MDANVKFTEEELAGLSAFIESENRKRNQKESIITNTSKHNTSAKKRRPRKGKKIS